MIGSGEFLSAERFEEADVVRFRPSGRIDGTEFLMPVVAGRLLCRVAVVVPQQSTKTLIALDVGVSEPDFITGFDESVAEPLMISFPSGQKTETNVSLIGFSLRPATKLLA